MELLGDELSLEPLLDDELSLDVLVAVDDELLDELFFDPERLSVL